MIRLFYRIENKIYFDTEAFAALVQERYTEDRDAWEASRILPANTASRFVEV